LLYAGFTQPEISAIALSISIFKRWLLKLPFLNNPPILFADPVLALKPRFASLTSKTDPCLVSSAVVCSKIKGTDGESVLVVGVRAVVFASEVDSNPKGGGVLTMGASSADPKLPKQMARLWSLLAQVAWYTVLERWQCSPGRSHLPQVARVPKETRVGE